MAEARNSIIVIIPFFGEWPDWMLLFVESCRHNPSINWLIPTDCGEPKANAENIEFLHTSYSDFCAEISTALDIDFRAENPHKLCDLKLAYGLLFEAEIESYEFWGFGDLDVVYGNLRKFINDDILKNYDLISFHKHSISGHLCLIRNAPENLRLFERIPHFNEKAQQSDYAVLDELVFDPYYRWAQSTDFGVLDFKGKVYAFEAFSTPWKGLKWTDGTFDFPLQWFWQDGRLSTESPSGQEFAYLHYLAWKKGSAELRRACLPQWRELQKLSYIEESDLKTGVVISGQGIHPISRQQSLVYKHSFLVRMLIRFAQMVKQRMIDGIDRLKTKPPRSSIGHH